MAYQKKAPVNQSMRTLREDIKSGSFRRVYLLYGEEDYLVQQFKHELIRAAVNPEDGMNLNIHREEKPDWGRVQDEILSVPFFAERRMVVLEGSGLFGAASKKKGDADPGEEERGDAKEETSGNEAEASAGDGAALFAAFLDRIPETTVVLFVERPDEKKPDGRKGKVSVDRRGRMYKAVTRNGLAVEMSHPEEADLRRWVLARLSEEKIGITQGAMNRFLMMTGEQMSHIQTELEKLVSYAGPGGAIRTGDVEALVSEQPEARVFRMIDAIARRDRAGALALYHDLLQLRQPPVMVLVLLMKQFDRMLAARDLLDRGRGIEQIAAELSVQSWQARQLAEQARRFSQAQLLAAVKECVRMQEAAQSGHIDMQMGLELLIVKCSG